MSLDHRQLRAFLQTSELGSVGRAAKALHLTQPALSRLIRELERSSGLTLFERHPLGMRLTDAGEALVPFARSVLHDLARAEETIAELRGAGRGVVRVGAIAGVARQFLPRAVKAILQQGAECKICVLEGSGGELASALADGSIDIAIAHENLADDEVAQVRVAGYSEWCSVVCSTSHPFAISGTYSVEEVLRGQWVLPGPTATPRKLLEEVVRKSGRRMPRPVVETTSPSAVAAFVKRSFLLGWLPKSLYADEEEAGQICALHVPELALHRQYYIYKRRRGVLSPAAASFLAGLNTQVFD
jgi:DNA-binding transcriptional LysR family regulator